MNEERFMLCSTYYLAMNNDLSGTSDSREYIVGCVRPPLQTLPPYKILNPHVILLVQNPLSHKVKCLIYGTLIRARLGLWVHKARIFLHPLREKLLWKIFGLALAN
jgi:hypothetical protein